MFVTERHGKYWRKLCLMACLRVMIVGEKSALWMKEMRGRRGDKVGGETWSLWNVE